MFSHKKIAHIAKNDGTEITGKIKKVKRKKGLLISVAINTDAGALTLLPDEINHMYLPPSGLDKFSRSVDEAYTMSKWDRDDVESDLIKDGYVYFEKAKVNLKGKERVMLMQLLNPGFSSKIRVYFDPFAQETTRAGIGGLTVAGGLDKSYYIQRGEEPAYRMKKKEYRKDFENFFEDCPTLFKEYEKPDWPDFAKHVFHYSEKCN